jgi:hypothetical protein
VEQRRFDPLLKGPTLPIGESQPTENQALIEAGKSGEKHRNQNLVSGLFSESEFATPELPADLAKIAVAWRAVQGLIQAQTFDPARDASLYVIDIRPHSGLLMDVMALKE